MDIVLVEIGLEYKIIILLYRETPTQTHTRTNAFNDK